MHHWASRSHLKKSRNSARSFWHYARPVVILSLSCCFLVLFLATQSQAAATTPTGFGGAQAVSSPTAPAPTVNLQKQTQQVPLTSSTTSQAQSSQSSTLDPFPNPGEWLWQGLTYVWNQFWRTAVDFFQKQIIDWASSFGFMYVTPADLSYKNPMILAGSQGFLVYPKRVKKKSFLATLRKTQNTPKKARNDLGCTLPYLTK
ncbi:hypothetical protein [Ktedonobacter sp. SOSP1-52]|uniref:hypothetical protein n=1 Tax=Ktedonobacter sp. SOSP1-52 TaxID=2778366 RepID=UPI00191578C9|nr:hypothetical protein [Ktedonobacter sp. SOSP1-52]